MHVRTFQKLNDSMSQVNTLMYGILKIEQLYTEIF